MPAGVELESPLWLLAVPAVAAVLLVSRLEWWRAAVTGERRILHQELRKFGVRLGWTLLIVLALAGITIVRPLDRQATVLVLDASASTSAVRDQISAAARASES